MPATTPATYRDALARIARAAEQEAAAGMALWPMPPYDDMEPGIQRCYEAIVTAVAGTVLRDVHAHLETDPGTWIVKTRAGHSIERFAAAHGIALTESES